MSEKRSVLGILVLAITVATAAHSFFSMNAASDQIAKANDAWDKQEAERLKAESTFKSQGFDNKKSDRNSSFQSTSSTPKMGAPMMVPTPTTPLPNMATE